MKRQELHPHTANVNKSQKNSSQRTRQEALKWLAKRFPEAFDNETRIRPLKIGIREDILKYADEAEKVGISKSKLREAVAVFTRRVDYLSCLKGREMRIDLDGNPSTEVSEEEAERATNKLNKRVEKSARNARRNLIARQPAYPVKSYPSYKDHSSSSNQQSQSSTSFPVYPTRSQYHDQEPVRPRAPEVTVKHKASKTYDPAAVARLKAKLGLKNKESEKESEAVE